MINATAMLAEKTVRLPFEIVDVAM